MDAESTPTGTLVVLSTVGSREEGTKIAETLVRENLAACVQILPGIESVYTWKGEIHRDAEVLLICKTTEHKYRPMEHRLSELHPYEVPEILALPVSQGLSAYLDWVGSSVGD